MTWPLFEIRDLKNACGETYYQRGARYAQQGHVKDLKINDAGSTLQLSANVTGSEAYPYHVNVIIKELKHQIVIVGTCSCPIGHNCKHVVASCIAYRRQFQLQKRQPSQADTTKQWLQSLKSPAVVDKPEIQQLPASENSCLLYYLTLQGNQPVIQVMQVRILKKGGFGSATPMKIHRILEGYNRDQLVTELDEEIVTLLKPGQLSYYEARFELKGNLGEIALQHLLTTGRLHWNNHKNKALLAEEPRPLTFQWQEQDQGQQLTPVVDPPASRLFQVVNPYFIDLQQFSCGQLLTELNPEQLPVLINSPIIPIQQLESVSREFLLELADLNLPAPVDIGVHDEFINSSSPIPILNLYQRAVSLQNGVKKNIHFGRLSFRYNNIEIEPDHFESTKIVIRDTTRFHIKRDNEFEIETLKKMYQAGFDSPQKAGIINYEAFEFVMIADSYAYSVQLWQQFIDETIPELEGQHWIVNIDDSFALRFDDASHWIANLQSDESHDWFDLQLGVQIDGEEVNLLPALVELLASSNDPIQLREILKTQDTMLVPLDDSHWLKLPSSRILSIFDTLIELYDSDPLNDDGRLRLSRFQGLQMGDLLNDPGLSWHGAGELQRLAKTLEQFDHNRQVETPLDLQAQLRPYQQQGLYWLQFLRELTFNGILADDMGLGKTVQTLAHLLHEKNSGSAQHPTLIVAPTSLMGNWRREAQRFTPTLSVILLHGTDRKDYLDKLDQYDIALTTYALIRRDLEKLQDYHFHYIVLDEAQAIKNPKSQTSQGLYSLNSNYRLCLTGTPMENHLGELWSMYHFLMPGYLGALNRFNRLFRKPIESHADSARLEQLKKRIKPFLLRRTKQAVASELPEKTEIVRHVILEDKQRDLYESIRLAMDKKVRNEIKKKGLSRSHIMILDALLKLRQVCCDPGLVSLDRAKTVKQSAKMTLLMEMLPELIEEGRKILVFSQFTSMLAIIEKAVKQHNITYSKLTGQTRKRDEAIDFFQNGPAEIMLISLKAGGVGLNLTAADTVIHYDPWWNPAVENQATDRAHRIGQDKAVFVYKLITENTVEDKIIALQQRKQQLAESMYATSQATSQGALLSAEDLEDLLQPII
ncbi:MAG: DEAD/DEAH box helicase [Gammaproteobacteria bacterium]|nr:DEAD/DEAH box helicase [Gammaproteobacteria bacterium]